MSKLLIPLFVLASFPINAQENFNFYGSSGNYEGNAQVNGPQATYHGSSGELLGSSTTTNDQTNFYGSSGQYLGSVRETNSGMFK